MAMNAPPTGTRWHGYYGNVVVLAVRDGMVYLKYESLTTEGERLYRRNRSDAFRRIYKDPLRDFWSAYSR